MIVSCPISPAPRPAVQHDWRDSHWVSPVAPREPSAAALSVVAKET